MPELQQNVVGILALQGGVAEHAAMVSQLGAVPRLIRNESDLEGIDALILPGGESSTIDRLSRIFGLSAPLQNLIAAGLPTLGTCAGLIMLANSITDPAPGQDSLRVLDVVVDRNAFGSQVFSTETDLEWLDPRTNTAQIVRAAFIRAPRVVSVGAEVAVTARHHGEIVGVQQRNIIGISFHPELTGDTSVHERLLALI